MTNEIKEKINMSYSKIQFISDIFCQTECFEFTERSQAGFFHILDDLVRDIESINKEITI